MKESTVSIYQNMKYDKDKIKNCIERSGVLEVIRKQDTVLLKPNFVQEKRNQDNDWDYVITHPVLISAVLEMVADVLAGLGGGRIIVADAPMTGSSFSKIMEYMPDDAWRAYCAERNVPIEIIDLRDEEWKMSENGIIVGKKKLKGDPLGKLLVNLENANSEFYFKPETSQKLYGADYDVKETNCAHNGHDNKYSVSRTVISADVLINLPKMKTHKKGGITCCLKNLVGINTNKNLLPHHTIGTPQEGGDQFASSDSGKVIESGMTTMAKRIVTGVKFLSPLLVPLKKLAVAVWGDNNHTIRSGAWYGNDTLWRTIMDLNKVMFYANPNGGLRKDVLQNRKRYIGIVDGILAGEGNGPVEPDKKEAGVILCGNNPVAIDCVAAKIMGYDYRKIPQLRGAFEIQNYKIVSFAYEEIVCDLEKREGRLKDMELCHELWKPPLGWEGHIEL